MTVPGSHLTSTVQYRVCAVEIFKNLLTFFRLWENIFFPWLFQVSLSEVVPTTLHPEHYLVVPGHSNSRPATGQPARPAQVQYLVPYHSLTQSGSIPAVAVPTGTVPVLYTSKNQQYFLAVMAV